MKTNSLAAQHYLLEVALRREKTVSFTAYPFNLPAVRHLASQSLVLHPKATFLSGRRKRQWQIDAPGSHCSRLGIQPGRRDEKFLLFNAGLTFGPACRAPYEQRNPSSQGRLFPARGELFQRWHGNQASGREPGSPPIIGAYGGRYLHDMSHGESFFALLLNRFFGHGLYILDEPEAALSPTRQLAMLACLHELAGQHSQFIIATHSPILMAYPDADIYQIDERGLTRTADEDTEHYIVAKSFLNDTKRQLARLCT